MKIFLYTKLMRYIFMIISKKNYVKIISILVVVALIILSFQFAFNSNASNYSNINFKNAYLKYHGNYFLI